MANEPILDWSGLYTVSRAIVDGVAVLMWYSFIPIKVPGSVPRCLSAWLPDSSVAVTSISPLAA